MTTATIKKEKNARGMRTNAPMSIHEEKKPPEECSRAVVVGWLEEEAVGAAEQEETRTRVMSKETEIISE
ncbi:unnamed protein product [Caenorhabditis sp. 36 PRJEB53466]|nr:unnamed protein product [Caenorhabditis sp. 36 PRJEB53466]